MKKISSYIFMGIAFLVFIIIIIMLSPMLNIKNIEISGTKRVDKANLIRTLELDKPTNIFMFNKLIAKKKLKNNYYIENINIKRNLPNTLVLDITERDIIGYIPYVNGYLYINNEGIVVDTKSAFKEHLPIVYGISFDSFTLGKPLNSKKALSQENEEKFSVVMEIASTIHKKELSKKIINIDVSDIEDIRLYVDNIDVVFGDKEAINIKINTLNEVLKNFSAKEKGVLYIDNVKKPPIFKYIT